MKNSDFEKKFDNGENISEFLLADKARRPNLQQRRVNVDFPAWMIEALDQEARKRGVTRQSIIKMWLSDRLQPRAA
jgi:predicted DNA binding CopG/RHH family protein